MRTGYALRPVSLYNTVHTDSFTATIIIIIIVIVIVIIIIVIIIRRRRRTIFNVKKTLLTNSLLIKQTIYDLLIMIHQEFSLYIQ